ncbi:MAG: aminotransferase class I/II-fold pyridoxal phosphate-dependent enzyme, partial [Armatimonadetes bacterium]|nr:aminotransferase class I/II-fold pyridoxal phosphate-dependent enzyme [Armatimonadota bacterium]
MSERNELPLSDKSPFLLRERLVELAHGSARNDLELLDASRGAANWQQRRVLNAWHALGLYAAEACGAPDAVESVALALEPGRVSLDGFREFAARHADAPGIADGCGMLMRAWDWLAREAPADWSSDEIVLEFTQAVAGRRYPDPPTLAFVQPIMARYLAPLLLGGDVESASELQMWACEGATTGIAQVAFTLARNAIIRPGDRVAMWWPTYEPLRDLVECQLGCEAVPIRRDARAGWTAPPEELARLSDPAVRLVISVSPGNPVPTVTSPEEIEGLRRAVAANPDLLIIADYVYMKFVDQPVVTELAALPRNTIGVYSVSKDFGLAGARLGMVLMHRENVAQRLMEGLDERARAEADGHYRRRSLRADDMSLHERMVADSRGVSFMHMSGLSTPLQALACLCALFDLIEPDAEDYFEWVRGQLRERVEALYEGLGLAVPAWVDQPNSRYSTVIDLLQVAEANGGERARDALSGGE